MGAQISLQRWQPVAHSAFLCRRAEPLGGCPHGRGEVAVPVKPGNHMPVQVRHHVTQGCNIDLGGGQVLAQGLLEADYIVIEMAREILGENWMPEYVHRANQGGIERVLV